MYGQCGERLQAVGRRLHRRLGCDAQTTGAKGANWLFFGEQHEVSDFYYRDELESWQRDGHLDRLSLAFSRDQSNKLYVCGDAHRMAKDVEQALKDIIAQHGGMKSDDAADYVAQMQHEKRYLRDVY